MCKQVLGVITFLSGSVLIGYAKFPDRYEEILATFAHTLPPPGTDIDDILTTTSVFDYCEVSKCNGVRAFSTGQSMKTGHHGY